MSAEADGRPMIYFKNAARVTNIVCLHNIFVEKDIFLSNQGSIF